MINHLAIIMDWNRRWAKSKFLPVFAGHKAGADNVVKIAEKVDKLWIKYLTLWALSSNNLIKRDKKEVEWIVKLVNSIEKYLDKMDIDNLKFETIWDIWKLPEESQKILKKVKEKTKNNTWLILTLALIYWWQDEIIRATKKIINFWINPENLTKEEFKKYLDTSFLPSPEVIVRTGWDIRHSGFLLFDSEYSEYYFTEKWWPAFDEKELNKVVEFFEKSKRNFGK